MVIKNTDFICSLVLLTTIALSLACSKRCVEPFSCNEQQAVIITETILGPGDILELKFTYAPQFSEALTVRPDGKIQMQLVGEVNVEGKSPQELQKELMELYTPHLKHPDVAVITRKLFQDKVYVGGEVNAPGKVDIPGSMTALEAIMHAGGFNMKKANVKNVVIIRHKDGQRYGHCLDLRASLKGEIERPFYLEPYDVVFVPRTTITKVNQWIDQYINRIIPQTGFNYSYTSGKNTTGIFTSQPDVLD
jgi:protein involved in polysaccharide export with SLBB domain